MQTFLSDVVWAVLGSLIHNWLALSLAVVVSAVMRVYVDGKKLRQFLLGRPHVSIIASVLLGALTPLCACGTTAVVVGMLTTTLPWGPIMAFLTSSPLMSPEGFILDAGILGLRFAIALTIASIVIGLGSGYLTSLLERRTDILKDQTRFSEKRQTSAVAAPVGRGSTCACSGTQVAVAAPSRVRELGLAILNVGLKQIILFYSLFVAVGYVINRFVPSSLIIGLFSSGRFYAVPLAALIGLPLYVTGEAALPVIQTLMKAGAGGGQCLPF